jgi:hypothetical protein
VGGAAGNDAGQVADAELERADSIDAPAEASDARADTSDAGPLGRCDALAPIRLYQRSVQVAASTSMINYLVKVENATGSALPLSSLKVRYYFTHEGGGSSRLSIFYTDTCCSNPIINFDADVVLSVQTLPPATKADSYIEIGFDAAVGSLAAGDAVQVELGFQDAAGQNQTQTNDYSFSATASGTQHQWDSCPGPQCDAKFTVCSTTVYRDDVLVWGTPP